MTTFQQREQSIKAFLGVIDTARGMAQASKGPEATIFGGIGWRLPDRSGQLVADFDMDALAEDLKATLRALSSHRRRTYEAFLHGAAAMRAACREVADEAREAIDELPLPDLSSEFFDKDAMEWRDRPPTREEVRALAKDPQCDVWGGSTQWMVMLPYDQTVRIECVLIEEDTYEEDVANALALGAMMFRPVTVKGELMPWPVLP